MTEEKIKEMKNRISMELQNPITQQDFEIICKHLAELEAENAELKAKIEKMKSSSKIAYIKGIRTMANALKNYDRKEGAWTDYFEHTVDKVLKNLLKE